MNTSLQGKIIIIIIYNLCVWPADMLHSTVFQMLCQICQDWVDKSFCNIRCKNIKYIACKSSKLFFLCVFSQAATIVTFLERAENTERSYKLEYI